MMLLDFNSKIYISFTIFISLIACSSFYQTSFSQPGNLKNGSINGINLLQTNSINLSQPIYQAISSIFFATQNVSSQPFTVTKEFVFEQAVMRGIGNVTNNMTFINTYLPDESIQAKGNGTIETEDGQTIDWISSDIGIIKSNGFTFQGVMLFNKTNSEKLSFLNNTVGIYKETPEIKRTIWLLN